MIVETNVISMTGVMIRMIGTTTALMVKVAVVRCV
jgi:hypothetical protein